MSVSVIWSLVWPIIKDFVSKYYLQISTAIVILVLILFAMYEHSSLNSLKQEMLKQNQATAQAYVHDINDYLKKQTDRDIQLSQQAQQIQVDYEQRMQEAVEMYKQQNIDLTNQQAKALDEINKQKKKKIADTTVSSTLDPNQRVKSIADKYGFKVVP